MNYLNTFSNILVLPLRINQYYWSYVVKLLSK